MSGFNDPRVSPEMREKLAAVDFGMEVQGFLATRIGKYLVQRAQNEVEAKTALLKQYDILGNPTGAKTLQMEIKSAEDVLYWLSDAIREGAQLMQQLVDEEQTARGHEGASQEGDITGS